MEDVGLGRRVIPFGDLLGESSAGRKKCWSDSGLVVWLRIFLRGDMLKFCSPHGRRREYLVGKQPCFLCKYVCVA